MKVFNPHTEDFTWKWNGKPYILCSGQTTDLLPEIATHLGNHLIKYILNVKDTKLQDYETKKKQLERIVFV